MADLMHRRGLLQMSGAVIAAPYLWLPTRAEEPQWATQTVAPFVEVEIASGKIKGGHSRGALAFKAIPYAGSVSGKNRFKAPPPVESWTGVRDCTRLGSPAPQGPGTTFGEHEPKPAEDCLILNVWTPAVKDGGKRPVMFYLHGGGFTTGSGGQNIQDGSHLAATYDVVVVAINHRLGLLGYLYLGELGDYPESGNQGQLDMVAALSWVKQNISVFGGDPNNVMVFGESGGGYKTAMLMGMPSAHGLFHKAGIQSGPGLRGMSRAEATETTRRVLAAFNLTDPAKLFDVPVEKILGLQLAEGKGALATPTKEWAAHHAPKPGDRSMAGTFGPVTDGKVLPADPFDPVPTPLSASMPLLIGNTRDEAVFFYRDDPAFFKKDEAAVRAMAQQALGAKGDEVLALYKKNRPNASPAELVIAVATAMSFGNDTITLADRKSQQPAPVYRYRYDYQSNAPVKGSDWTIRAGHASDISLVFLNQEILDLQGNGPGLNEAAHAMSSYFTSFARNAAPKAANQPAWPRYSTAKRPVMLINSQCQVVNDPDSEERKFWQSRG
ncbi:para-nitrobenzyl esterase [Rhizomicrobium palustre]|uniref:Carboxylic ester hydrolase n=1 Tax=Rhizomicrobium palustre TaxID=189966 RepID=A0A846MZM8_9PROT|nr:carboxylesterase family protein [Rhizomicrobium palustre]NIK88410.1 para-nitrobenzyl esterase [Rhizomicrobium palustre]